MKLPQQPEWQRPIPFYGKELKFYPLSHRYKWGNEWVPSVTTIINRLGKGDALVQWAANCAVDHIDRGFLVLGDDVNATQDEWQRLLADARKAWTVKRDDAGDIGTRVHEYARGILEGKNPPEPLDGPAQKAIEAFWRWVESHRIQPLATERRVMSAEGMFAGTCDFYGYIDDRLCVLDFKTGRGVYDEAWWQTSAYVMALQEELRKDVLIRWIVHLDKETGECTAHVRDDLGDHMRDMVVWQSLLALDQALRVARKHPKKAA